MKKHLIMALMAAFAAFTFCSCGDDEVEKPQTNETSIVGEWSGIRPGEELTASSDVYIHFNFKKNGTYEEIMPAWGEKDLGKYTISGNVITFVLTSIRAIGDDSADGDLSFYDKYGCYYDSETDTYYKDPLAQFKKGWPGRVNFSAKYTFDKNGNLHLEPISGEGAGMGLELVYHNNPGYKPYHGAE